MSAHHKTNVYKQALASNQLPNSIPKSIQKLLQKRQQAHDAYIEALRQTEIVKQELDKIDRLAQIKFEDHQPVSKISPQIIIDSIEKIPLKYVSYYMHRKINLPTLLKDLEAGQEVSGAHLVTENILEVSCN